MMQHKGASKYKHFFDDPLTCILVLSQHLRGENCAQVCQRAAPAVHDTQRLFTPLRLPGVDQSSVQEEDQHRQLVVGGKRDCVGLGKRLE